MAAPSLLDLITAAGFERLRANGDDDRAFRDITVSTWCRDADGVRFAIASERLDWDVKRCCVWIGENEGQDLTLLRLVVDPDKRNQGHGRRFLQEFLGWLDLRGLNCFVEPVPLEHVKPYHRELTAAGKAARSRLLTFYRQAGFRTSDAANDREGRVLRRDARIALLTQVPRCPR